MTTPKIILCHVYDKCAPNNTSWPAVQTNDGVQELYLGQAIICCLDVSQVTYVPYQILRCAMPLLYISETQAHSMTTWLTLTLRVVVMGPMVCRKFISSTVHRPQIYWTQIRINLLNIATWMLVTRYNLIQFHSPLTVKNGLFNIYLNFMASFQTFKHLVSNLCIYSHFFLHRSTSMSSPS